MAGITSAPDSATVQAVGLLGLLNYPLPPQPFLATGQTSTSPCGGPPGDPTQGPGDSRK
jgi:hypothetical protein